MFDEAKRWFEAATVICRFVPGGQERAEKVRQIRPRVSSMASPLVCWLTDGTPIPLRFQKLIPIFFHAMGQNAELQEPFLAAILGLRLDNCSVSAPLRSSFLRTVLFRLL
jgi:hypothetical protein